MLLFSRAKEHVSEPYLLSVFAQLSAALFYCHHGVNISQTGSGSAMLPKPTQVIIHRDLKPGNGAQVEACSGS